MGSFGLGGRSGAASRRTAAGSKASTAELSYAPPCPRAGSFPNIPAVSSGPTSWNQFTSIMLARCRPDTHSIAARTVDMLASCPLTTSTRVKPASTMPASTSAR